MAESRVTSVLAEILTPGQSQARVSSVVAEVLISIAQDEPEIPVSTGNAVIICLVSS